MNLLTGLLPNTSSSCQVLNTNLESESLRKSSFAQSGNAINSTIEIVEPELIKSRNRRKSMAFTISAHVEKIPDVEIDETDERGSEPRVNFILPHRRRSSIIHQNSQPTLRERVKGLYRESHWIVETMSVKSFFHSQGSPRFPHRIVPTSSLNALEDSYTGKTQAYISIETCFRKGEKLWEGSVNHTLSNQIYVYNFFHSSRSFISPSDPFAWI